MRFSLFTLFPDFFTSPLQTSLIGKAINDGLLHVRLIDFRHYTTDNHRSVDDIPYGGGPGMVLKPEPIVAAMEANLAVGKSLRIYLTPWGEPLKQKRVEELATYDELQILCGRYEGVDERVIDGWIDLPLSIGDFVLAGGEAAALCLIEAVARYIPGVLGTAESLGEESFSHGLLEGPQYTRPATFRGQTVPDILTSGHHGHIAQWRKSQALARTKKWRPELLEKTNES